MRPFIYTDAVIIDALIDACLDSLKLWPFLFLTYLFMEWMEHAASDRFTKSLAKTQKFGPLVGALLGVVPQCGFSGAAAALYAARVISLGTLVSIFLATSDEMLPIMIASAAPAGLIVKILAVKVVCGMLVGFILDFALRRMGRTHVGLAPKQSHEGHEGHDISKLCEADGCACSHGCDHEHGRHAWGHILLSALKHSVQVLIFVLVITVIINLMVLLIGENVEAISQNIKSFSVLAAGVLGLIPNCAISVGLTELYLTGILSGGAMVAGLLSNAGVGLLVLMRTNENQRENLRIVILLVVVAILVGFIVDMLGLF